MFMDEKKDKRLVEQDAPLKNTDKAFVKVNKDGSPAIPQNPKEEKGKTERERTATGP
jgi:hypothetical protein